MERKTISEKIFEKKNNKNPITFKEIEINLQPDDIIEAGFDEGFYSEDNSWDPYYYLRVTRERPETDKEFQKRLEDFERQKQKNKEERFKYYLQLKKEFEN